MTGFSRPTDGHAHGRIITHNLTLESVTIVAGRGRPPEAAARRPALRKSRGSYKEPERSALNDRRIDRPLLRNDHLWTAGDRSGQAGVGGHAAVCGDVRPGRCPAAT